MFNEHSFYIFPTLFNITFFIGLKTIALINTRSDFERIIKQIEYCLIEARKKELERELKDLNE